MQYGYDTKLKEKCQIMKKKIYIYISVLITIHNIERKQNQITQKLYGTHMGKKKDIMVKDVDIFEILGGKGIYIESNEGDTY